MSKLALFVRYGVEVRVFLNETTREKVKGAVFLISATTQAFFREYTRKYGVQLGSYVLLPRVNSVSHMYLKTNIR